MSPERAARFNVVIARLAIQCGRAPQRGRPLLMVYSRECERAWFLVRRPLQRRSPDTICLRVCIENQLKLKRLYVL